MEIVTLTLNPALDKSTTADRLIPEQKIRCGQMQLDAGGGGINVSKGIAILGGKSTAVFPSGGDSGKKLQSLLHEAGIAVKAVDVAGETRENISVLETMTNVQYRLTLPGQVLSMEAAEACLKEIEKLKPQFLVASGSLPPGLPEDYYARVAEFAKTIDAKFILDTSGNALYSAVEAKGIYLLKPNLKELAHLVGKDHLEMNEVDDAALSLIQDARCRFVAVSLGPQGALMVSENGFEHIPAPMVPKRTTVGAGDSMVAGMVWSLFTGSPFREAVQIGVACGTAATMQSGTRLFKKNDVEKLLDWIKTYGERYKFTDF